MTDRRIPRKVTPIIISGEERGRTTWLILLIIALIFLILTVIVGYFVLGKVGDVGSRSRAELFNEL